MCQGLSFYAFLNIAKVNFYRLYGFKINQVAYQLQYHESTETKNAQHQEGATNVTTSYLATNINQNVVKF